jgi:hypothetical protein
MKTLKFLVMAVVAGTLATSCGKYDDGPKFSLLSKKTRLVGDWDIKETTTSGGVTTADNVDDTQTFKKDKTYTSTTGNTTITGTWDFSTDKKLLELTYYSGSNSNTIPKTILRLTQKELWLKDNNGAITKLEAK